MRSESAQQWKDYLGNIDARYEERLDLYVDTGILSTIKWGDKATGHCVIVGAKGTGKTATCEHIRTESEKACALIWRVDDRHRFMSVHVSDLGEYPPEVESVLLNVILTRLVDYVRDNKERFPEEAKAALSKLDSIAPKLKKHFGNLVRGTTFSAGPIEWDFGKILAEPSAASSFTSFDVNEYIEYLKPCFAKNRILVLFDDIDDVFLGADKPGYTTFVEGLIRAARTLNLEFKDAVHFLVFMKYGVYRTFFDRPRDYDKVKSYILVLRWSEEDLERMLARRIAKKLNIEEKEKHWQVWAKLFYPTKKTSIDALREYLVERCPSGPRDLIDFVNRAIEQFERLKITLEDIIDREAGFSESKITGIYQDYGYTYPDVHHLIRNCFSSQKGRQIQARYSREEFEDFVFDIKTDPKLPDRVKQSDYFLLAHVIDLIRIFYTVGLIGYEHHMGDRVSFVLDDPKGDNLRDADFYVIHKVFWKALGIEG